MVRPRYVHCVKLNLTNVAVDPNNAGNVRSIHKIKWDDMSQDDRNMYYKNTKRLLCGITFDHSLLLCDDVEHIQFIY